MHAVDHNVQISAPMSLDFPLVVDADVIASNGSASWCHCVSKPIKWQSKTWHTALSLPPFHVLWKRPYTAWCCDSDIWGLQNVGIETLYQTLTRPSCKKQNVVSTTNQRDYKHRCHARCVLSTNHYRWTTSSLEWTKRNSRCFNVDPKATRVALVRLFVEFISLSM